MVSRGFVVCAGLVALVFLSGCVSSADLTKVDEKVDEKVGALEGQLKSVEDTLAANSETVTKMDEAVKAADERLKAVSEDVDKKVASVKAEMSNVQTSLKAISDEAAKLAESLKAVTTRLEKAEADASAASKQLPTVRAEIEKFGVQFEQMQTSLKEAQALMVKNLENARDIYKTQFMAIDEVLQNLKKETEGKKKAPEAEE